MRELCDERDIGYAWHTGSVPQQRRRAEINAFKDDPDCRVFLSTDSGATGLNLQVASVVINCDLPWNPAKLEQRIARAWRKHQTRPVTVINLISENTIEHRMLETLALKQTVATSVLDRPGEVKEIKLRSGRQAMVERLQQLVTPAALSASNRRAVSFTAPVPPIPRWHSPNWPPNASTARWSVARSVIRNPGRIRCWWWWWIATPPSGVEKLKSLHWELFGPGKTDPLAPVQLEVIDRATDEAIQRLIAAGLIGGTTRATRPLLPPANPAEAAPLSPEEQAKAGSAGNARRANLKWRECSAKAAWAKKRGPPCWKPFMPWAARWPLNAACRNRRN